MAYQNETNSFKNWNRRAKNMKFSAKNVEDKKSGEYRLSHHLDLKLVCIKAVKL